MKNENGMAFLRHILFCLSDVSLQRYDTSKFEKNTFFTKSAAVHNFYIAFSSWNLNLNSKSNKIWKNEKGMAFLRNILFCRSDVSLQRYKTSKFEKNAFFTKSAAVHNFYIANSPWNLYLNSKSHKIWKNEKGMAFLRNIYFVCRTFRCKDMAPQIGGRF